MQYDDFLEQVAECTGLNRAYGDRAIVAVLETLSERIGSKDASDLATQLPRQLRDAVADAPEQPVEFPADVFVRKVAAREWIPTREARAHTKVVLRTLREVASDGLGDVLAGLPADYHRFWSEARPSVLT
ncbi:MAG: DUF2267 domain-containing protein [Candidatus Dormibacteraeota bacterium]|nr:DUF2267 domain-containing protein [Candidatus Dormibacteraeota bacterium]